MAMMIMTITVSGDNEADDVVPGAASLITTLDADAHGDDCSCCSHWWLPSR